MKRSLFLAALTASAISLTACGSKSDKPKIRTSGSTTVAPIATAWSEHYDAADVSVAGAGSGIGINDLIESNCDIACSSRPMKDDEREKIKAKHGKDAKEFIVAYDAVAIYANPENPIESLSLEQLHNIFTEGGNLTKWEQIEGSGMTGDITVFGREKTSGTYEYIHDAVVGKDASDNKMDFVKSISPQSSSQAIIGQLNSVKSGIGYDGMAFNDPGKVKWLAISPKTGEPAVLPSADDARSKKYPLSRPLFMYTVGEPEGAVKEFLAWGMGPEGQKLVAATGNVSLK